MDDIYITPPPGSRQVRTCVYLFVPIDADTNSCVWVIGFSWVDVIEAADFDNARQLFSIDVFHSDRYPGVAVTLNSSSLRSYQLYRDSPDDPFEILIIFDLPRRG